VIPKIDSDIGISIYSTSSDGCGGKIRQNAEDFLVSEILSDKTMSLIKQNDGYAVYKLKKTKHRHESCFKRCFPQNRNTIKISWIEGRICNYRTICVFYEEIKKSSAF